VCPETEALWYHHALDGVIAHGALLDSAEVSTTGCVCVCVCVWRTFIRRTIDLVAPPWGHNFVLCCSSLRPSHQPALATQWSMGLFFSCAALERLNSALQCCLWYAASTSRHVFEQ
jgi:hypothetical protein